MSEETAAPVEGQAAPPPEAATPAAEPQNWAASLPDEYKGYVENKGWKDPSDLLHSYQNLEKLRGVPEDKILRWPDDPKKEGAMDPIYSKIGRPETPDKYTNVLGDGFDPASFKVIAESAHLLGLGDGQFQGLQQIVAEQSQAALAAQEAANVERFDAWAASNPDGVANAGRVLGELGMTEDQVAAMLSGDKTAIYDFAAKVGARTSEAPVIQGQGAGEFAVTPTAAKAKIAELMSDKDFMAQYTNSSAKIRQPAIDRMMKLHEQAGS